MEIIDVLLISLLIPVGMAPMIVFIAFAMLSYNYGIKKVIQGCPITKRQLAAYLAYSIFSIALVFVLKL